MKYLIISISLACLDISFHKKAWQWTNRHAGIWLDFMINSGRDHSIMEDQSGVLIQDQPHQQLILVHSSSHHHQQRASNMEFHGPCLSPLHRDVCRLVFPQRTDRGRKNPGGPRKWEAHTVRQENEPRLLSWLAFCVPLYSTPPVLYSAPQIPSGIR